MIINIQKVIPGAVLFDSFVRQIIEIQMQNHKDVLSASKQSHGFVTLLTPPSYFLNKNVLALVNSENVAGYIIATLNGETLGNRILEVLKEELSGLNISHNPAIIAQVCVDKASRQQGIAKALYTKMEEHLKSLNYTEMVTEIDATNAGSKKLHEKLGFNVIKSYTSGSQRFEIVSKVL